MSYNVYSCCIDYNLYSYIIYCALWSRYSHECMYSRVVMSISMQIARCVVFYFTSRLLQKQA